MAVKQHRSGKLLAALALGMLCFGASAQQFSRDIQLAKALNEIGLTDYADEYINDLLQKNPGNSELTAQRIDNLLAQNKTDIAMAEVKKLQPGSETYIGALASVGTFYVTRQNFDVGIKQLEIVRDYAMKNGKIKEFKEALQWLFTAYQKAGKTDNAQQLLEQIQQAESNAAEGKRDTLYGRSRFGLEGVENMQVQFDKKDEELNKKFNQLKQAITMPADQVDKKYNEVSQTLGARIQAVAADPDKLKQVQALLAKKAEEDKKYYDALNKFQDPAEAGKARMAVYNQIGALVGLSQDEMADIARIARVKSMNNTAKFNELWNKKNQADGQYYGKLRQGGDLNTENAARLTIYKQLGSIMEMPHDDMVQLASITKVKALQKERRSLMISDWFKLNDTQKKYLDVTDPNDWQDVVYKAERDLNEVLWGGQDVLTAMAVAQIMRADYYLKNYEPALKRLRKYKELFRLCDDAYRDDKEFGIEASPGADAKMWEGYLSLGLAGEKEAAKDPKEALKYYKQAFAAFGTLLKKYPKHKDGGKNYPQFIRVAEKIAKLDPGLQEKIDAQIARVPKPELKESASVENEELVTPIAATAFKTGTDIANANIKKDRSPKPSTDADWAAAKKEFKTVADELLPKMSDKRRSPGLTKLMNHLIIAYGYLGDDLMVETLIDLGKFRFRDDPLIAHGTLVAANAYWLNSERLAKDPKKAEEAKLVKDKAIALYDDFLFLDPANQNAPQAAVRIAREEFVRANAEGEKLNAEKSPDARAVLKNNWLTGFDKSIARYNFVRKNFSNRPEFIDEAFEKSTEAYMITKRYPEAVAMGKAYCENGSTVPGKIITAKMDIASNLFSEGGNYEKEARTKREEAVMIVIPQPVKPELKPVEATATPAAAPAAQTPAPAAGTTPAAQPAAAPAAPAVDPAKQAQEEYEKALKQYEEDVQTAKVMTEKRDTLNKEAEELDARAKACYQEALTHLDELFGKWLAPNGQYAAVAGSADVTKTKLRAASLYPWLYDGVKDFANAAKKFEAFVATYPKEKSVPQYLLRLSVLYTEANKDEDASRVLNKLSAEFKDTPEGKNAKFSLARNLFVKGNYERAINGLHDIFSNADLKKNLSVSNYRWIASDLAQCKDPTYGKIAASYALLASDELLRIIKNPKATDWVGDLKAKEFEVNRKEADEYFASLNEKLLVDAAAAASAMEDYQKAAKYYTDLERLNKNTPFYYAMCFGRANAYIKLKKYEDAKRDLVSAGRRANLSNQTSLYNKAQVMIGDICETQGDDKKAYAYYSMVAALPFSETTVLKVDPDNPEDDTPLYLERAVYKAAEKAKKLGKTAEMTAMIEKYQKYYPDGKFKIEVKNLAQ